VKPYFFSKYEFLGQYSTLDGCSQAMATLAFNQVNRFNYRDYMCINVKTGKSE